jgi:hypothetical protein
LRCRLVSGSLFLWNALVVHTNFAAAVAIVVAVVVFCNGCEGGSGCGLVDIVRWRCSIHAFRTPRYHPHVVRYRTSLAQNGKMVLVRCCCYFVASRLQVWRPYQLSPPPSYASTLGGCRRCHDRLGCSHLNSCPLRLRRICSPYGKGFYTGRPQVGVGSLSFCVLSRGSVAILA